MTNQFIALLQIAAVWIAAKCIPLIYCRIGKPVQRFWLSNSRWCRGGHPISKLLNPVIGAKRFRTIAGVNLALAVILVNSLGDIGGAVPLGPIETAVLSPENIQVLTETRFRFPVSPPTKYTQGYNRFHPGVDIRAGRGEPVFPIAGGVVAETEMGRWGYGHKVVVSHPDQNLTTLYAHLDKINVKAGAVVGKNTKIGTTGTTGWSTGPHLHLEIKNNQGYLNPKQLLPELN